MTTKIKKLDFIPFPGLSSRHLQTIVAAYRHPGAPPPSKNWLIPLADGDIISCEVSTPKNWEKHHKTILLVHGLGGSHASTYMVRIARKFYEENFKVVRINLRGCGSGSGLSKLPYHGGNSEDVKKILHHLKQETPDSDLHLIGFSLGGNIVLKLAGELGQEAEKLVKHFIAVCAPLDLGHSVALIEKKRHSLYHHYFLKKICKQGHTWMKPNIDSLYKFDNLITAPLWGYKGADEYYQHCSSIGYLPKIQHTCHLLFAEDDPFVDLSLLKDISVSDKVQLWATKHGGHMGFLGRSKKSDSLYWMDHLLLGGFAP